MLPLDDLVLDYTKTLHSASELVEMHRKVVERFRALRTVNGAGVAKWTMENSEDSMTYYVVNECEHHVRRGRKGFVFVFFHFNCISFSLLLVSNVGAGVVGH